MTPPCSIMTRPKTLCFVGAKQKFKLTLTNILRGKQEKVKSEHIFIASHVPQIKHPL